MQRPEELRLNGDIGMALEVANDTRNGQQPDFGSSGWSGDSFTYGFTHSNVVSTIGICLETHIIRPPYLDADHGVDLLRHTPFDEIHAPFSPDGRWLAY